MRPLLPIILLLSALPIAAHDSPQHDVEKLTRALKKHPNSAATYYRRGISYQELGKLDLALTDFKKAVKLAPATRAHKLALARLHLTRREVKPTLTVAQQLTLTSKSPRERATSHALAAEAQALAGDHKKSLTKINQAITLHPPGEIEWLLLRSENQRALKLHPQRISDLTAAKKSNPSAVLHTHWVDALIDAGQYKQALTVISCELTERRLKSHWLIKQARALIGLKRNSEAQQPLYTALKEIRTRLQPAQPDIFLLADQAEAYTLLENKTAAQASIKKLKKHQAPRWLISRLETLTTK